MVAEQKKSNILNNLEHQSTGVHRVSKLVQDFISLTLNPNPPMRCNVTELLRHEWITQMYRQANVTSRAEVNTK